MSTRTPHEELRSSVREMLELVNRAREMQTREKPPEQPAEKLEAIERTDH